jgi:hypothetical protein
MAGTGDTTSTKESVGDDAIAVVFGSTVVLVGGSTEVGVLGTSPTGIIGTFEVFVVDGSSSGDDDDVGCFCCINELLTNNSNGIVS